MSHHDALVPNSVIREVDEDDDSEFEVSFDWTPATPSSGEFGPPEHYDPGSGEEFYIVEPNLSNDDRDKVADWLVENWTRPDRDDDGPDYYTEAKDRRIEERNERYADVQD